MTTFFSEEKSLNQFHEKENGFASLFQQKFLTRSLYYKTPHDRS